MKHRFLLTLAFCVISLTAEAQKETFEDFLSYFKEITPPLTRSECRTILSRSSSDTPLPESVVKQYICNSVNRDYLHKHYLYRKGVWYKYADNYILVVTKDRNEPGDTYYNNLLGELILIAYAPNGRQIDQTILAQSSDMYVSDWKMITDSTSAGVQSTLLSESFKPPYLAKIDYYLFTIGRDGKIIRSQYKPQAQGEWIYKKDEKSGWEYFHIMLNGVGQTVETTFK